VLLATIVAALDGCVDAPITAATTGSHAGLSTSAGFARASVGAEPVSMRVCNAGVTATFTTTAPSGVLAPSVTLPDGHCALVWHSGATDEVNVTLSRTADPAMQSAAIVSLTDDVSTVQYAISSISVAGNRSVAFVFFTTAAGDDPWTLTKSLIKSCEDYNAWLAKVREALEAYKAKLLASPNPNNPQIAGQVAAIQKFLDNAAECAGDSDLESKKMLADVLLRPIDINKALAALWASGFQLYAAAIDLIVKSLTDPVGVPFDVINRMLDFMIEGANAVGNTEGAKQLKAAKELKDRVKRGLDTVQHLKDALEKVRPILIHQ
jgi:hypothetical protein